MLPSAGVSGWHLTLFSQKHKHLGPNTPAEGFPVVHLQAERGAGRLLRAPRAGIHPASTSLWCEGLVCASWVLAPYHWVLAPYQPQPLECSPLGYTSPAFALQDDNSSQPESLQSVSLGYPAPIPGYPQKSLICSSPRTSAPLQP